MLLLFVFENKSEFSSIRKVIDDKAFGYNSTSLFLSNFALRMCSLIFDVLTFSSRSGVLKDCRCSVDIFTHIGAM